MSTVLTTRRFALWWRLAREWFESKFSNIKTSTPYITEDGSYVVFNYFTPKQMEKVYIWLEGGNLWFELTKDEEGQYSLTTKCDIEELDGMFIVGGEEFILDTIVDTLSIDLKGYKVSEVRIEGIDADLLNADFTWRLAEIGNKLDNIKLPEIDTTELAKQGDNPEATNSAIYDAINAISPDLVQGKERLATAITSKGVETTSADSLSQMAENVNGISQESYTIDGGEMYAKQLYGSLAAPNCWNLYEVLQTLLSDGRLANYGGILLAESCRGYDSIALEGAGSGGAYVVSDKDENGQFKIYTKDTTHLWATEFDGKGNRWVAYCFSDEYHDFQITDTDTSPRSIFIGRKVGMIKLLSAARISQIVIPDGNNLKCFNANGFACDWNKALIIRNLTNSTSSICSTTQDKIELMYISADAISAPILAGALGTKYSLLRTVIIEANQITGNVLGGNNHIGADNLDSIIIKTQDSSYFLFAHAISFGYPKRFYAIDIESGTITANQGVSVRTLKYLYFSYITNDKTKSVSLAANSVTLNGWGVVEDVELKNGWCKSINLRWCTSLTKENVQAHIFDRLGVNDLSTGAVTITLATTVLDLFTQEEIDAVVARTNITIVGA